MTTSDAMLAAVLANPDDDTPRLIYADWLEENGEALRAEFIRAQCEAARIGDCPARCLPGDPPCAECVRRESLRRREQELLSEHGSEWCSGIATLTATDWSEHGTYRSRMADGWRWEWRRGFIESITCTCRNWLQHAEAITRTQPVRDVRLTECMEMLRELSTNGGPVYVRAYGFPVGSPEDVLAVVALVWHAPTKRLRRLVLADAQLDYGRQEHFAVTAFPGVEVVFEQTGNAGPFTIGEHRNLAEMFPLLDP